MFRSWVLLLHHIIVLIRFHCSAFETFSLSNELRVGASPNRRLITSLLWETIDDGRWQWRHASGDDVMTAGVGEPDKISSTPSVHWIRFANRSEIGGALSRMRTSLHKESILVGLSDFKHRPASLQRVITIDSVLQPSVCSSSRSLIHHNNHIWPMCTLLFRPYPIRAHCISVIRSQTLCTLINIVEISILFLHRAFGPTKMVSSADINLSKQNFSLYRPKQNQSKIMK